MAKLYLYTGSIKLYQRCMDTYLLIFIWSFLPSQWWWVYGSFIIHLTNYHLLLL